MVKKAQFKSAAVRAVRNITSHGDTDIFPFPFENFAFSDKPDEIVALILEYDKHFYNYLTRFPPQNVSSLTPVTYSGFRWATQIDPIWNAHFLSCVLALATKIEKARPPKTDDIVFSYRYAPSRKTGNLFDVSYGWFQFMKHSNSLSEQFEYVVVCDIAEFYARLGHHRLENALKQIAGDTPYPKKIMSFLKNYSNTRSFGLPIGGPAARLLSEITINQVDQLLIGQGIVFARFADDYHLFATSREDAYRTLVYLSEKLLVNQGLSLQKAKTRILTAREFRATSPIRQEIAEEEPEGEGEAAAIAHKRHQLMRFSLRFDPYSPTSEEDYRQLKAQIREFDILGLLKEELSKSRIHAALTRKVLAAIRYLEGPTKDQAVLSLIDNATVLYPIFSSVLMIMDAVFEDLAAATKSAIVSWLQNMLTSESYIFRVDVHLSYAIRVIAHANTADNQILLQSTYETRTSPLVRKKIILTLARWGDWYWLSDRMNRFRELSADERRAFILASYTLRDEGVHWRQHIQMELSPIEKFILEWARAKANPRKWIIPV